MKFITKNGFTLIETILSLWITTLSLFLFTSSISILKSYKYDDFIIEDANFINQIQLIYALGENKTIENGMLHFYYNFNDLYFEFYHDKLILKEGYQIFLNHIKDVYFSQENGCVYLNYERNEWHKEIIGCI